jgi:hypothetical protein
MGGFKHIELVYLLQHLENDKFYSRRTITEPSIQNQCDGITRINNLDLEIVSEDRQDIFKKGDV